MIIRRRLTDQDAAELVGSACRTVTVRTTRPVTGASLADEIIDRRLATHSAIASVIADGRPGRERSRILEPLRVALRRESAWLLSPLCEQVDAERAARLLRDVDDVVSPDSIDCLIAASGDDITVVKQLLTEALTTIFTREGPPIASGSPPH